ncbi:MULTISPECIES: cupin domain-containing protein [Clostridia]|uniref:cupin domain-containing protein n=1 Tax=Clostridia TaxID=186801 RepID=UPI000EA2C90E|nr:MULTISPECIES: cupin domain-containing protein [Clostridia]NBJ71056.1 cupin domain-containing protein [Roseburia sp. 1XD42-34]RKI75338.1 cupin domain-containing protein [Clostridium sp. 1xD42-85]
MDIKRQAFLYKGLNTLFETSSEATNMSFGTVTIPPGERVPNTGVSRHLENEYSIILKGELQGESGGARFEVRANDATFIPAGEKHWAINTSKETCEIVWVLVKEK